ncbi:MAG: hypothetical protein ACI9GZ_002765 [Bacteroidia bacterium]|jgi:uncharacterized protein (TIGR02646 family)
MLDRDNRYTGIVLPATSLKLMIHKEIKKKPLTSSKDWSNYASIKTELRKFYSTEQKGMCAYCRMDIEYDGKHDDLEHIIHKDHKYIWMLEPRNLVLSCKICNTSKLVKHSLKAGYRSSATFPYHTSNYRILHPQLDLYEDNISIIDNYFVRADSPKGFMTILICDLWRPHLAIKKAKMDKIDNHGVVRRAVHRMDDLSLPKWERKNLRKLIKDVIAKRPL